MNDSLDLRNRILKMRENNNLTVNSKDALNNDLMSEFESSINDDNQRKSKSDKDTLNEKNKETMSKSHENNSDIPTKFKEKSEYLLPLIDWVDIYSIKSVGKI